MENANQQKLMLELKSCYRQKQELETLLQNKKPAQANTLDFSYYQIKRKSQTISKDIEKLNSFLTPNIIA